MTTALAESTLTIKTTVDFAAMKADLDKVAESVGISSEQIKKGFGVIADAGLDALKAFKDILSSTIATTAQFEGLSKVAGVSASQLMSLSKVASLSGISAEALASSMNSMNMGLIKSGEAGTGASLALKAIGLNYNEFMKLAPDQRMVTVAGALDKFKDGAEKSAVMMQLFGQNGADLLPVMEELADKGLSVANATDQQIAMAKDYETNMRKLADAGDDLTQAFAMGMLPAMDDAAKAFVGVVTETGGLGDQIKQLQADGTIDQWARGAITGLTYVADVFEILIRTIKSAGLEIAAYGAETTTILGGLGEAISRAVQGDFTGALNTLNASIDGAKVIAQSFADDQIALWTEPTVGQGIRDRVDAAEALRQKQKELGDTTQDSKAQIDTKELNTANAEAMKQQKIQTENLIKSGADYVNSVKEKLGVAGQDLEQNVVLTEGQSIMLDMHKKLTQGQLTLNEAQKKEIQSTADLIDQKNAEKAARDKIQETVDATSKGLDSEIDATNKSVESLRTKNNTMFNTKQQMDDLHIAALLKKADDYESLAVDSECAAGQGELAQKYREAANALRDQASEEKRGAVLQAAKDAKDEWQKTIDSISNGLTDGLMKAFESGKGFAQAFKDTLENAFKQMILQPTIKGIVGGMFGTGAMGASASVGGDGTGLMGGVSNLVSMGKSVYSFLNGGAVSSLGDTITSFGAKYGSTTLQDFGSGMSSGSAGNPFATNATVSNYGSMAGQAMGAVGGYFIGSGINKAISGGYQVSGGVNTIEKVVTAAASAYFGPIGGAVAGAISGVVNRAFGMGEKKTTDSGISGSIGAGDATGSAYADWKQKGGWFRKDKRGTTTSAMDDATSQALDAGAQAVYQQTKAWAEALKLPAEQLAKVTTNFKVSLSKDEVANQAAIAKIFTDYQTALTQNFSTILAPFQHAGETLSDTMSRLVVIDQVSYSLNEFGGIFSAFATSSIGARESIISLAGGIDNLTSMANGFVSNYYSQNEQQGLLAKDLQAKFSALGIDGSTLASKDDFRKLIDSFSTKMEDPVAQKQLVGLLALSSEFAQLGEYLKQNGETLAEAAKKAPETAILEQMLPAQESTSAAVADVSTQIQAGNQTLIQIVNAIQSGNTSISNGLAQIASSNAAMAAATAAQTKAAQDSAKAAQDYATQMARAYSAPTYTYNMGGV